MNILEIKLNKELMNSIKKGSLKTIDLITYILDTTPNFKTIKDINNTSLHDLKFDENKYVVNAKVDTDDSLLMLTLEEDKKKIS